MELAIIVRNDEDYIKRKGTIFSIKDENQKEFAFVSLPAELFDPSSKVIVKKGKHHFIPKMLVTDNYASWFNYFEYMPHARYLYPSDLERGDMLYINTDNFHNISDFLSKIEKKELRSFSKESAMDIVDIEIKRFAHACAEMSDIKFYGPTNP